MPPFKCPYGVILSNTFPTTLILNLHFECLSITITGELTSLLHLFGCGNSSVNEPHIFNVNVNEPHSGNLTVSEPHSSNLRSQFVDFQVLIRCFSCTQCGQVGITITLLYAGYYDKVNKCYIRMIRVHY